MTREICGSGIIDPDGMDALREWQAGASRTWPETWERIRMHSLTSGMEVVYNLSMFDLEWSPVYWHESGKPIAWINNRTGERRDGADMPTTD